MGHVIKYPPVYPLFVNIFYSNNNRIMTRELCIALKNYCHVYSNKPSPKMIFTYLTYMKIETRLPVHFYPLSGPVKKTSKNSHENKFCFCPMFLLQNEPVHHL